MRKLLFVAGALAVGVLLPSRATAQRASAAVQDRTPRFELTPYAGLLLPADLVSGPLGTHIGFAAGPLYGAQVGVSLVDGVTLVGQVGMSTADIEAGLPIIGGVGLGQSETLLFDGGVQLSLPGASTARPFLHVGAGGMRREVTVQGMSVHSTAPTFQAGLGVDLNLADGVGVRLLARDHVGKFDFGEAVLFDYDGGTMHNVALSGGLKLAF